MKAPLTGVAKRLVLSLVTAAALGGCAVYEPAYTGSYAYDPDPYGRAYPSYYYAGPPLSIDLLFDGRSHRHHGHHGFRGHRGHHGHGHHGFRGQRGHQGALGHHGGRGWSGRRH